MSFSPNFPTPKDDNETDELVIVDLDDFIALHHHLTEATKIFEKYYKKGV